MDFAMFRRIWEGRSGWDATNMICIGTDRDRSRSGTQYTHFFVAPNVGQNRFDTSVAVTSNVMMTDYLISLLFFPLQPHLQYPERIAADQVRSGLSGCTQRTSQGHAEKAEDEALEGLGEIFWRPPMQVASHWLACFCGEGRVGARMGMRG